MKLIVATGNEGKMKEIRMTLADSGIEAVSLKEAGIEIEIEENGTTFEENAIIKAQYIANLTGVPALSDDSGLEVKALGGAPGVYSARYAGEPSDSNKNNEKLLKELKNVSDRTANFTSVIAICFPNGETITAKGQTFGSILTAPQGNNGFGYDPLFFSNDLNKCFGIATSEEKNAVSHRGRALQNLKNILTVNK